jgi:hypothetical protein
MASYEASRTLVKSPPELWEELSEVDRLARHLEAFGEIRITRREPQRALTWEADQASGRIRIEESGWGTKVTLEADLRAAPAPEPDPEPDQPTAELPRHGGFSRFVGDWFTRSRTDPAPAPPAPEPVVQPEPPSKPAIGPDAARAALDEALDTLGAAHHRPFSRG